jgi:hypothetical protein
MKQRIGRVERGILRAFIVEPDRAWSSRELLRWAFPRLSNGSLRERHNACRSIRRAASNLGVQRAGRVWPGHGRGPAGVLWRKRND